VKRPKTPKLVFKGEAGEWLVLEGKQEASVTKALANPIRREIYNELDDGAMQQSVLARLISGELGKKFSNALLRHHLQHLEQAGLVGSKVIVEAPGKPKMVYRRADVRVQLSPRETPTALAGRPPRTREEFIEELKRTFKKPSDISRKESDRGGRGNS